jgi:hypothetical protein
MSLAIGWWRSGLQRLPGATVPIGVLGAPGTPWAILEVDEVVAPARVNEPVGMPKTFLPQDR